MACGADNDAESIGGEGIPELGVIADNISLVEMNYTLYRCANEEVTLFPPSLVVD
jgi:hypothetical protein